jgi:hypothetical protein
VDDTKETEVKYVRNMFMMICESDVGLRTPYSRRWICTRDFPGRYSGSRRFHYSPPRPG